MLSLEDQRAGLSPEASSSFCYCKDLDEATGGLKRDVGGGRGGQPGSPYVFSKEKDFG